MTLLRDVVAVLRQDGTPHAVIGADARRLWAGLQAET